MKKTTTKCKSDMNKDGKSLLRMGLFLLLFSVILIFNIAVALAQVQTHNMSEIAIADSNLDLSSYQLNASYVNSTYAYSTVYYDSDSSTYYLDPSNSVISGILLGKLGLGSISPSAMLEVNGTVNATNITLWSNCVDGQVLKWSDGVGKCGSDDTGAADMSGFTVDAQTGTGQDVNASETLTVVGLAGVNTSMSDTNTLTISLNATTGESGSVALWSADTGLTIDANISYNSTSDELLLLMPADVGPYYLQVGGDAVLINNTYFGDASAYFSTSGALMFTDTDGISFQTVNTGVYSGGSGDTETLQFLAYTNATVRMNDSFEIVARDASYPPKLVIRSIDLPSADDVVGTIDFQAYESPGTNQNVTGAMIRAVSAETWIDSLYGAATRIEFFTQNETSTENSLINPRMVIDHRGRVTIGQNSTTETLHVNGTIVGNESGVELQDGNAGVVGTSNNIGVLGKTPTAKWGVVGNSSGAATLFTSGVGVFGTGSLIGVVGAYDDSNYGYLGQQYYGVYGIGETYGGYFYTSDAVGSNSAVYGEASGAAADLNVGGSFLARNAAVNVGVIGNTSGTSGLTSGAGVFGTGTVGVVGKGSVYGIVGNSSDDAGSIAGYFEGPVNVTQNLTVGNSSIVFDGINNRIGVGTKDPSTGIHLNKSLGMRVEGYDPVLAAELDVSDFVSLASDIEIVGDYAYIVGMGGLVIVDISNPRYPKVLSNFSHKNITVPQDIFIAGRYAYISTNSDKFTILDISDFAQISVVYSVNDATNYDDVNKIIVSGSYALVSSSDDDQLMPVDISDPLLPVTSPAYTSTDYYDNVLDFQIFGEFLYAVSCVDHMFTVLNITDMASVNYSGSYTSTDDMDCPVGLAVEGSYAYVIEATDKMLIAVNITDPKNPVVVSTLTDTDNIVNPSEVFLAGDYIYVTEKGTKQIVVYDVSNVSDMYLVGNISNTNMANAVNPVVKGKYLYTASVGELYVYELSGIEAGTASIGAITSSVLDVDQNARIRNNLYVDNAINVGPGGIYIDAGRGLTADGPLKVLGDTTLQGDLDLSLSSVFSVGNDTSPGRVQINNVDTEEDRHAVVIKNAETSESSYSLYIEGDNSNAIYVESGTDCYDGDGPNSCALNDYAEMMQFSELPYDGDVVIIDPESRGLLKVSTKAYDPLIAGVASEEPAMVIGDEGISIKGWNKESDKGDYYVYPLAIAGRKYVKVTDENGPVKVGDFLVSSSESGKAMRCDRSEYITNCVGAVIGKAMTEEVNGKVLVLINMQ